MRIIFALAALLEVAAPCFGSPPARPFSAITPKIHSEPATIPQNKKPSASNPAIPYWDEKLTLWVGTWSARSLSNRAIPIVFSLQPDGKAAEQVGSYHGVGTWKAEGDTARIQWESEWFGLLRRKGSGGYELLTWKKGTPIEGPPDDTQPAQRIENQAPHAK